MTTTPAAISPRHADDDGPVQNADPNADPTGFRILPSRLGPSFIPVTDRHRRLISGLAAEAYTGRLATSVDFASRD
jgi:hypothetical protein